MNLYCGMKATNWFTIIVLGIGYVYGINLFIDAMDVDATQYAAMSFEMIEQGNFLTFTDRYANYLDKPPLVFWLVSTSYRLFGISNWSFKLPSLLFALLGIYSTFRLARLYYTLSIARLAALILATTQAMFLITNDCRTDTLLLGAVAFSLWQLGAYLKDNKIPNLLGAFFGIGLAMLAKGPIGLVMPVLAFGPHLLLKSWRDIFRWQWLLGLLVTGLVITPMCIGLYIQYDSNPEVVVNGQKGVSGLYFYFWKQSFGRITGESEWQDDSDAFFFVHTFGWAFLPWTLFALAAILNRIWVLIKWGPKRLEEVVSLAGFVLPWIAFSLSRYKLPHYIFVFFPLAAILTAQYIVKSYHSGKNVFTQLYIAQFVVIWLLWLIPVLILVFVFEVSNYFAVVLAGAAFVGFIINNANPHRLNGLLIGSCLTIIGINFVLSLHFYPNLLTYQGGTVVGRFVRQKGWNTEKFCSYKTSPHSLDFYSRQINRVAVNIQEARTFMAGKSEVYFYGSDVDLEDFKKAGFKTETVLRLQHFHVSTLNIGFLNSKTRNQFTTPQSVIKVIPNALNGGI